MYILILLVMVVIASAIVIIVGLKTSDDNKLVIKLFVGFSILIVGFYAYAKITCGANYFDVKVMKPMAEKISTYIVKNGIPKSLKDIPDLPYGLEGCERSEEYWKTKIVGAEKVKNINNATSIIVDENCNFIKNKKTYYINMKGNYIMNSNISEISIFIGNKISETWGMIDFHTDKNKNIFMGSEISFDSGNTSGICNPMRQ